ncbi:MAG: hypothetical protein ACR2QR_02125, partial [Woeseiaceae bacterium]
MLEIATILIGFSIVSSLTLLVAYLFFLDAMQKSAFGKLACAILLLVLATLQFKHLQHFSTGESLLETRWYLLVLIMAPISFYFFSREILLPDRPLRPVHALNLLLPPAS